MTEAYLMKTPNGSLAPVDFESAEKLRKLKVGQGVRVTFTRSRNIKFHRKYFSLLNLAFDSWEPPEILHNGNQIKTPFKKFREMVTIMAGYYDIVHDLMNPGSFRYEAKSISFANMDEEEFEGLYSSTIDVLLDLVFKGQTRGDIENLANNILSYD